MVNQMAVGVVKAEYEALGMDAGQFSEIIYYEPAAQC